MPKTSKAVFTFNNTTYNGANIVGTHEVYAFGSISENIKPSISMVRTSEAVSGLASQFQTYVQNKSKVTGLIEATAGQGSYIASYQTFINDFVYTGKEFTSNVLTESGEITITFVVTDARGRTDTMETTIKVVEYDIPQVETFSVVRCSANGDVNVYGEYVKVNINASISPVNNRNGKLFKLEYKKRNETVWTSLATYSTGYEFALTDKVYSGIGADFAYDFRLTCTDYFVNGVKLALVPTGFAMFDLNKNGKGISIGKVSERNAFECALPMYDRFDTEVTNGLAMFTKDGEIVDANTTLEDLVVTFYSTPDSGFYFIRTMFFDEKSTNAIRTQIAFPYAYDESLINTEVYTRTYIPEVGWSEWKYINDDVSSEQHSGLYKKGSLGIETGKVVITPTANTPTGVSITFKHTYKNAPVVFTKTSTNLGGTYVLADHPHVVSTTGTTIYLTRTNSVATNIFYVVIGEVV